MNNPMSRKLFQSREAREKLRGMGGIMASSPELAQTVAKFNNGGDITVPIVEGPNTALLRQIRGIQNTTSEMQARNAIVQEKLRRMEAARQAAAANRFDLLDSIRTLDFLPEEIPVVDEFGGLPPEMTEPGGTVETGEDISIGGVLDDLGLGPALAPVRDRREEAELQEAAAAATEEAIIPQMEQEMRDRAAREEALVAEERRRAVTGVQMEAEAEADDRESRNFRLRQAQERAAKELARDTDGGDGGPAPFDFDASFEQALSRVGRVMGGEGKDEDSRKKAMANLAMIGLAIAAGQSPDALTNIAQGALSGMQAMTAQEARERDLERESRLTALEMTEKAADRASAERIAAIRGGRVGSIYADPQRTYAETRAAALATALAGDALDIMEGESPAEYADRVGREALQRWEATFGQSTGANVTVPTATVPTVATQADYDALPPGAEFIQNGQRRRKPE
jgi:hypothetical protein